MRFTEEKTRGWELDFNGEIVGITEFLVLGLTEKEGDRVDDNRESILDPFPAIISMLLPGFKLLLGFIQKA